MQLISWLFLIVQAGIVVASLLGYGIFTSRPDLLMQVDPQARFFVWAFHGFAVGNMLFGGLAVLAEAVLRDRKRAMMAFVAVYVVSLTSELLGTAYGVPFGAYSYTSLLGPKWFDLVPLLIPLSWFTMSWPVWIIARRITGGFQAVLLGTCLLVAWDLLLDPAMSRVTSYWCTAGDVAQARARTERRFTIFDFGVFRQFSSAPGILRAKWLLDCHLRWHRGRSGGVPGFWFREGVPPASGFITEAA